jgi:hypothetical protein
MNEVLIQIAKQAMVEHCISHVRLQEFAELIVKKCAQIVNENDCEGSIVGDGMLFEHFGVKE